MYRKAVLLVVCLFAWSPACAPAQQVDKKVAAWVEQVVLGPEYGSSKVVARWVKSPSISIFGGNKEQIAATTRAIADVNEALAKTPIKLRLVEPKDDKADIQLYLTTLSDFTNIARMHNFNYVEGNWGYFRMNWNRDFEIQKGYVLIAIDKLMGDKLRHFLLEEIVQVLGPGSDSPVFPDSIFFQNGNDGGNATKLSELDKKLLRFLFNHLKPGSKPEDVRTAFKEHWQKS